MIQSEYFRPEYAPRSRGKYYPGVWPGRSFILSGKESDTVFDVVDWPGREFDADNLVPRLGHAEIEISPGNRVNLDVFLGDQGLALMDFRIPVLAVGSNASPAQLRHKFADAHVDFTIPCIKGIASNIGVGFQRVFTSYGALATTVMPLPEYESELFVQFLDREQLRVINDSELGYDLVKFESETFDTNRDGGANDRVTLQLETGEYLPAFYAYMSQTGFLTLGDKPVVLGNTYLPSDREEANIAKWTVTRQINDVFPDSVRQEVLQLSNQESIIQALRRRKVISNQLARTLVTVQDGLVKGTLTEAPELLPGRELGRLVNIQRLGTGREAVSQVLDYREVRAKVPLKNQGGGIFEGTTVWTADGIKRNGESVVLIPPSEIVGYPEKSDLIEIWSPLVALEAQSVNKVAPSALARVAGIVSGADQGASEVQVDEMLRFATGLRVGERVAFRRVVPNARSGSPAGLRKFRNLISTISRFLLGDPPFVYLRVTKADITTIEREYALLPELTLGLLGVQSGDRVILEAVNHANGHINKLKVRAHAMDSDTLSSRRSNNRGSWSARYPRARDALGEFEDLPAIMIDSDLRTKLGLGGQPLGVVRARSSRPWQYLKSLRDVPLAIIGVAISANILFVKSDSWPQWVLFALLVFVLLAVSFIPTRMRLTSKVKVFNQHREKQK